MSKPDFVAFLELGKEHWVVQRELVAGLFPGECGQRCGEVTVGEELSFYPWIWSRNGHLEVEPNLSGLERKPHTGIS